MDFLVALLTMLPLLTLEPFGAISVLSQAVNGCSIQEPIAQNEVNIIYSATNDTGTWVLVCNITWQSPEYPNVQYLTNLVFETNTTSFTTWRYESCGETSPSGDPLCNYKGPSENLYFSDKIPFTHKGLFQIAYTSSNDSSLHTVTNVVFETPDCYEVTSDVDYCTAQNVYRCSKPRDVELVNSAPSPTFKWSSPIQVNKMATIDEYKLQIYSADGDLIMTDTVLHQTGVHSYTWKAINAQGSNIIDNGGNYSLTVAPYVSYSNENTPSVAGRLTVHAFSLAQTLFGQQREVDPLLRSKEVPHRQVVLEEKLGEGEFGVVIKGSLTYVKNKHETIVVAVKTTKVNASSDANEDLLNEMKLVAEIGDHENILCLLACCSIVEPFYLITEFMMYGDLQGFLRKCREREHTESDAVYCLGETKQIVIARDIARGMTHIQEKRFYHGDLAARNVLVGKDMSIKVSDFGLADDIYTRGYKRRETEQKIPVKWCSIETILNGICSSEGDEWSFGVVLYEIITFGGTPYPGIAPRLLVPQLCQGYRMEQPKTCPDDIYELMTRCWKELPNNRPRFEKISDDLEEMLVKRTDYLQFDYENYASENDAHDCPSSEAHIGNNATESLPPILLNEDREVNFSDVQSAIRENKTETEETVL